MGTMRSSSNPTELVAGAVALVIPHPLNQERRAVPPPFAPEERALWPVF